MAQILDRLVNGVAYCQLITEAGQPTDWQYLYANPAFNRQTGLGPVVGKRVSEVVPAIHRNDPLVLETVARVVSTGKAEQFETFIASLDNWFTVHICPLPRGCFLAEFAATTAAKRREDELHAAQERLALAQRASHAGVWDWDMSSGALFWSPEFMQLFGLDPAVTQPSFDAWRATVHPDDLVLAEDRIQAAVVNRVPLVNEYRIVLPGGETRWIRAHGNTMYDEQGRPLRMIGICLDFTDSKALAEVAAHADAANQAKSSFIATMSHELRTPLNSVIGFSALMLEGLSGDINEQQRTQLAMIRRSGEQLLDLVDEVLDIAKIEAGRLGIERQRVDLGMLIHEQCDLMRLQASGHGLKLVDAAGDAAVVVTGDGKRLRQVIRNLVSNAIKYTDRGFVRVGATVERDVARVSVADSGIGVPQAEQARLFVPFGRIRMQGEHERSGTGLGLVISRRLVEAMGGEIGLTSEAGCGSTFWFTVPLAPRDTSNPGVP